MASWLDKAAFPEKLDDGAADALAGLKPQLIKARTVLFQPGVRPQGFLIIVDGRAGVYLTGKSGRELLLYSISRGETCVQTTLGLLGDEPYSAEAIAETDMVAVMVPAAVFQNLMAMSAAFRNYVFRAFAARVSDVMFVLEQVAFVKVESRLAHALLERADDHGLVAATHHELTVAIGSAREVVSRQLNALSSRGFLAVERGHIVLLNPAALLAISRNSG